jgi:FeS assembly SUF system protein
MVGRQVDYVESFLTSPLSAAEQDQLTGEEAERALLERVVEGLRTIYDPEIPVNIYDLGLVYDVEVTDAHVTITMTLTTPHCPVAETMPGEVETRVGTVPGVGTVTVNIVWTPPWDPSKMSDEARLELGML